MLYTSAMANKNQKLKGGKQKEVLSSPEARSIAVLRDVAKKSGLTLEVLFDALAMGVQSASLIPVPVIDEGREGEERTEEVQTAKNLKSWADEAEEQETIDVDPITVAVKKVAVVEESIVEDGKQTKESLVAINPATEVVEELSVEEGNLKEVVTDQGNPNPPATKSYSDIVKGNRAGDAGLALRHVPVGEVVEISEAEWEEGARIWEHTIMSTVVSHKPSYAKMMSWVEVN